MKHIRELAEGSSTQEVAKETSADSSLLVSNEALQETETEQFSDDSLLVLTEDTP